MTKDTQEESIPLTAANGNHDRDYKPRPSTSSASTASIIFEHIHNKTANEAKEARYGEPEDDYDTEENLAWKQTSKPADGRARRILWIFVAIGVVGWVVALFLFLSTRPAARADRPHDPHATHTPDHGAKVTLEQVLTGQWYPRNQAIQWIAGTNGEDGLLLERGSYGKDYLVVEDVRHFGKDAAVQKQYSKTLMKDGSFRVGDKYINPDQTWPSPDHKKVLIRSSSEKLWRHSSSGLFWIFDVATQQGQPLDPAASSSAIQIASWSPASDAVVFTRDNNMYIRHLDRNTVDPITRDGGAELFYGRPDWVYEEEVYAGDSVTWWSGDGKYVAYLRTNESLVPEFPVQYFLSRPTGSKPAPGEENYPDVRQIKYPKAGAPMSVVNLQFYDTVKGNSFEVNIEGDFADDDRLITEVVWAGKTGKLLVKVTNRESDIMKVILIDAEKRTGKTVREENVAELDGGWFEVSETTTYVPAQTGADVAAEHIREQDGYIDTVIHNGFDHLAYFSPLDNPTPKLLTEGKWEVVKAPSAVDSQFNLVYFVATKANSIERHIYSVDIKQGPESIKQVTPDEVAYYDASFSKEAHFMLLTYEGPGIPWQAIRSTPSNPDEKIDLVIEKNDELNGLAKKTELPIEVYSTISVDGFDLNVVERRPPHFDASGKTKYPVLFYLYNGPGFQAVDRTFHVDFQSYVASSLGYIVVTVDGRGTGYLGRDHRCIVRGNLGYWEAHDQIAVAKEWAAKKYVDSEKVGIWGWSYGGFMTLKVLETDAGNTFKYGMAVAPVTDWRLYDSIYTERYMHTPQHNPQGYDNATISNMTALGSNVRFLVMHGVSDDNVHFQNTLFLLDKLDQANIRNYDVHVFPDSDHGIYFHNANRVVYEKLSDWIVNAFNGEWLKTDKPQPTVRLEGI